MITTIFILLIVFQFKHFLADYPLQRPWMLGKFRDKGWVLPLAAHCLVHAAFTLCIGLVCSWVPLYLAIIVSVLDFILHFTMDRIKASGKLMGRWKPLTAVDYGIMQARLKDNDKVSKIYGRIPGGKEGAKAALRGNRMFWNALGIDQMVHHLTHYAIIFLLIVPLM